MAYGLPAPDQNNLGFRPSDDDNNIFHDRSATSLTKWQIRFHWKKTVIRTIISCCAVTKKIGLTFLLLDDIRSFVFSGMSLTSIIIRLRCFIIIPLNLYTRDGWNRNKNNKDRNLPRGFLKIIYHLSIVACESWEILFWFLYNNSYCFHFLVQNLSLYIIWSTRRFLSIVILKIWKTRNLCIGYLMM